MALEMCGFEAEAEGPLYQPQVLKLDTGATVTFPGSNYSRLGCRKDKGVANERPGSLKHKPQAASSLC